MAAEEGVLWSIISNAAMVSLAIAGEVDDALLANSGGNMGCEWRMWDADNEVVDEDWVIGTNSAYGAEEVEGMTDVGDGIIIAVEVGCREDAMSGIRGDGGRGVSRGLRPRGLMDSFFLA
ncbi:hypothetical protein HK101_002980 [Irineochytrium annulatum]|nr:hypothetical protein HK101_002980 [Irineochytrium annulatum]